MSLTKKIHAEHTDYLSCTKYVLVLGDRGDDYAVYQGPIEWHIARVAEMGDKIFVDNAIKLFPDHVTKGNYRS